jgi:WD40 repeat protein
MDIEMTKNEHIHPAAEQRSLRAHTEAVKKASAAVASARESYGEGDPQVAVAFSADGRSIVTPSHTEVKICNLGMRSTVLDYDSSLRPMNTSYYRVLSGDGKYVLQSDGQTSAKLWSQKTGQTSRLRTDQHLKCGAFSPDSKRVLTLCLDETAKIWDTETGTELLTLKGTSRTANAVAFSSDGRQVHILCNSLIKQIWYAYDYKISKGDIEAEKAIQYKQLLETNSNEELPPVDPSAKKELPPGYYKVR